MILKKINKFFVLLSAILLVKAISTTEITETNKESKEFTVIGKIIIQEGFVYIVTSLGEMYMLDIYTSNIKDAQKNHECIFTIVQSELYTTLKAYYILHWKINEKLNKSSEQKGESNEIY